jgi:4-amino-4-deoxy-L-arabinose transferase-like glycosyltransferase
LLAGSIASLAVLRDRRAAFLASVTLLPLAGFALLSSPWSARYILPLAPITALTVGGGFSALWAARLDRRGRGGPIAALALALAPAIVLDARMLRDFSTAPLPSDERLQLVTGWPAGYGLQEIATALRGAPPGSRLYVESAGPRTPATSLPALLAAERRAGLDVRPRDLVSAAARAEIAASAASTPTFVVGAPRFDSADWKRDAPFDAALVLRTTRPGGEWAATLFRIAPLGSAETRR